MKYDFSNIKVLLIGDFMLDHYIFGSSNRMSPEAPVPVVIPKKDFYVPGGAGNVAINLSSLGANIDCIGIVGNDKSGDKLISLLNDKDINTNNIKSIDNYQTTLKKRIYSNGKQLVRLDSEEIIDWNPKKIKIDYENYDLILFSDYNKGVINSKWPNIPQMDKVIVDPKKKDMTFYKGANIITPNLNELQQITNQKIKTNDSIVEACNNLIKEFDFNYVLAKKGSGGMSIVGKNSFVKHIDAHKVENPDVTGAGDTAICALSLAYTLSNDLIESVKFANAAAALAVSKPGTAKVTIEEINNYISL